MGMTFLEENLTEQNKLLEEALLFFYDHKLNNKTKIEVIVGTMDKVRKLRRKITIKLVK